MVTNTVVTRAQQHGLDIVSVGDRVEVRKGSQVLAFHADPGKCLELALGRMMKSLGNQIEVGDGQLVIDAPSEIQVLPEPVIEVLTEQLKGSIIKPQYKTRYKKNGSCGDDLSDELRAYIEIRTGGRTSIDLVKLKEVAVTNGVWLERYGALNPGQQRMTIGNRLRAKWRSGDKVDIGGVVLQQG